MSGHYRTIREIGSGGMGRVYEAIVEVARGLTYSVALKIPHAEGQDDEQQEMFLREVETARKLSHRHPNLMTVFGGGETPDGRLFMVMELIDGATVSQLCEREAVSPAIVASVARALVSALSYLHQQNVLHRDVSSGNVLLGRDGHITLGDFGLAKQRNAIDSSQQHVTLPYASPEQLRGETLAPASDLFSVGAVLFKLATGERPFAGDTSKEVLQSMDAGKPALPEHLSPALAAVIHGLLEPKPAQRSTATNVLSLLSRADLDKASKAEIAAMVEERVSVSAGDMLDPAEELTIPLPGGPVLGIDAYSEAPDAERLLWKRCALGAISLLCISALLLGGYSLWPSQGYQPEPERFASPPEFQQRLEPASNRPAHADPPTVQRAAKPESSPAPANALTEEPRARPKPPPQRRVRSRRPAEKSKPRPAWTPTGPWQP